MKQLRHYNSTVWASTFIKTDSITGAGSDGWLIGDGWSVIPS